MEEFLKFLKSLYEGQENTDLKVFYNDEPVIDIENGKDMLKKPEVVKTPVKEEPLQKKAKYETPKCTAPKCEMPVAPNPYDQFQITQNIYKDPDEETYYVRESANGARLSTERPIVFDYKAADGIVNPGFTDADLAFILLYRNRNDKVKYNALMDFIKAL